MSSNMACPVKYLTPSFGHQASTQQSRFDLIYIYNHFIPKRASKSCQDVRRRSICESLHQHHPHGGRFPPEDRPAQSSSIPIHRVPASCMLTYSLLTSFIQSNSRMSNLAEHPATTSTRATRKVLRITSTCPSLLRRLRIRTTLPTRSIPRSV